MCGLATLAWIAVLVFGSDPARVEQVYIEGWGPALTLPLIALFRPFPTSAAEWVEALAIVVALSWIATGVWRVVTSDDRIGTGTKLAAEAYGALTSVLVGFYVIWGLAYSRPRIEVRLGWLPADTPARDDGFEVDVFELESLSRALVDRVNDSYLELHQLPDIGHMTGLGYDADLLDASLDRGWTHAAEHLHMHPTAALARGRTKPLLSSGLFTYLGIGGFYFPFTGEANINRWAPAWQQPHTRAHEMSHQRFVASENEANFMGFMAAVHSDDPLARYSGWLFAQRQVLRALIREDPWSGYTELFRRYPGVQRDVNEARAFWTRYDGALSDMGNAVNDAYLKANNVEGGVKSYGRSVRLLVRWARTCGALPTDATAPLRHDLGDCDPSR